MKKENKKDVIVRSKRFFVTLISCTFAFSINAQQIQDINSDDENSPESDEIILNKVVVTGAKIERSLQDTSTSVAVFDKETIDKQKFTNMSDILNQTANVSTAFNDGIITIRGLRNQGAGSSDGTSSVTAVYVDGVFLPSSLFTSGAMNLWDIDNAEIFRGPQSTVQGRNALAGAIVMNTIDPSDQFDADIQAVYSEYNTWRFSGAASVPLSDTFGLRVAIDESHTDGFIDNLTLMTDKSDERENTTFRAKALWKPVDELTVKLNYTDIENFRGDGRVASNFFPAERQTTENIQSRIDTDGDIASLQFNYDLNDSWNLTSVTSHTDTFQRFFIDTTRDENGGESSSDFRTNDKVKSQEFRANFETENMRGLIGAFLFDQQGDTEQESTTFVGTDLALPDAVTIASLLFMTPTPTDEQIGQASFIRQAVVNSVPEFPVLFDRASDLEIDNTAFFGEFDYFLNDDWTMTLGIRYDREDIRQNIFDSTIVPPIITGNDVVDPVLAVLANQFTNAVSITKVNNEYDVWLPKAALSYAWSEDITTAFSYQRGYRAGGLSINLFRAALAPEGSSQNDLESLGVVNSFDTEFTNNYEFAFRSQLLDNRLLLNANLFYIDYTDQQISVQLTPNPLDRLTENVGESEMYGLEIDTSFFVNPGLEIGGNLGYVRTEFTDGSGVLGDVVGAGLDLTGKEFSYAPRITGGAFARYEWASGWFVNGRFRYSDESFSFAENLPDAINDSYTVFDFIAGYEASQWRAELFVNNAFDEDYLTVNFGPDDTAISIAGAPRVMGVRFVGSY